MICIKVLGWPEPITPLNKNRPGLNWSKYFAEPIIQSILEIRIRGWQVKKMGCILPREMSDSRPLCGPLIILNAQKKKQLLFSHIFLHFSSNQTLPKWHPHQTSRFTSSLTLVCHWMPLLWRRITRTKKIPFSHLEPLQILQATQKPHQTTM